MVLFLQTKYKNDTYGEFMDCNVKNANYERVVSVMEKVMKERFNAICSCPRCINDIAAIALNYLPPHYFVDHESKEIGSPWVMVETAVVEAIDRVSENPNHPRQHNHNSQSADSQALMS